MQFQLKAKPDVKLFYLFIFYFFGYLNEFAISDKKKSLI